MTRLPVQAKIPEDYGAQEVSSATLVPSVGLGENVDSQRLGMTLEYLGLSKLFKMVHLLPYMPCNDRIQRYDFDLICFS